MTSSEGNPLRQTFDDELQLLLKETANSTPETGIDTEQLHNKPLQRWEHQRDNPLRNKQNIMYRTTQIIVKRKQVTIVFYRKARTTNRGQ